MIREFDWRDLALIHRLAPDGVCLHAEVALTRGMNTTLSAVRAYLAPGSDRVTVVSREGDEDEALFGQVSLSPRNNWARLYYLAPNPESENTKRWLPLLDFMAKIAAQRGAHYLVAEIDEASLEHDALRKVGFAVYTHQRIWRLDASAPEVDGTFSGLRPWREGDQMGVNLLYQHIVPRLIQQVQAPPVFDGGYVWVDDGEIAAYFGVRRGSLGVWVRPFLHPLAMDHIDALLATVVRQVHTDSLPLYLGIHSYQGGFQAALEDAGFALWANHAIMVKRLGVGVLTPKFETVPTADAGPVITPPMAKRTPPGANDTPPV